MKTIFIDTNIFLHFNSIELIPWLQMISAKQCELVVAPIVIEELDKKKRGTDKLSTRAKNGLKLIERTRQNGGQININEQVILKVLFNKPKQITYANNDLDYIEQDHRLIASIIEYKSIETNAEILLLTDDIGPRLTATTYGIEILEIDEAHRLKEEESEDKKLIRKLEKENAELKNVVPKLKLVFKGNKNLAKYELSDLDIESKDVFVHKKNDELRKKEPYMVQDSVVNPMSVLAIGRPTDKQIKEYNESLDRYYSKCDIIFGKIYDFELKKRLSFSIELVLLNDGTCPANGIDIHLHFPDGFDLTEKVSFVRPKIPKAPTRPKTPWDLGEFFPAIPNISMIRPELDHAHTGPTIKKTNSYDVDYFRKTLKHSYNEPLETLIISFDSFESISNFNFDYSITADNIPSAIQGKLNVVFE